MSKRFYGQSAFRLSVARQCAQQMAASRLHEREVMEAQRSAELEERRQTKKAKKAERAAERNEQRKRNKARRFAWERKFKDGGG